MERYRTHGHREVVIPELRNTIQTGLPLDPLEIGSRRFLRYRAMTGLQKTPNGISRRTTSIDTATLALSIVKEEPKPGRKAAAEAASEADDPDPNYYFRQVGAIRLLADRSVEVQLAKAIEAGRAAEKRLSVENGNLSSAERNRLKQMTQRGVLARKDLTEANLRLVISLALRYTGRGRELEDLI